MSAPPGRIRVEDRGHVRVLTIDNPGKRNAFDYGSLAALTEACARVATDKVRCLVIRGAGDQAFSSGFDIDAMEGDGPGGDRPDLATERAMEAVEAVPCPTVAFVNGAAFGAGCELAVTCDLRIASEGAKLGMPPAKLGVVYAAAGVRRFLALADEIAANAPLAVQGMKRILRLLEESHERGLTAAERSEVASLRTRAFESADLREGRAAWAERRAPRFRGE